MMFRFFNYLFYFRTIVNLLKIIRTFLNDNSFFYIRFFFIILLVDGLVLDDEPFWEPLEWSQLQTWIIFIYMFSWSSEVLFSSKYGSYTNRDKLVWISLFKTYYLLLFWFVLNLIIITVFVTLPFYFEITYLVSYIVIWWEWITSYYYFKLTSVFVLIILLTFILRNSLRWGFFNLPILLFIFVLLSFLLYFIFIFIAFSFFSNSSEYVNSGWSFLSKLVNGPAKWSWGLKTRDHFSYHRTPEVFWIKNDSQVGGSIFFLNIFLFLFLFFLLLQTLVLLRYFFFSNEISYNLWTYFYANIKYFYYLLNLHMIFIILSFLYQLIRFPFELYYFNKAYYSFFLLINFCYDLILV